MTFLADWRTPLVRYRICSPTGDWLAGSTDLAKLISVVRPGERIYRVTYCPAARSYEPRFKLFFGDRRLPRPAMSKATAARSFGKRSGPEPTEAGFSGPW